MGGQGQQVRGNKHQKSSGVDKKLREAPGVHEETTENLATIKWS